MKNHIQIQLAALALLALLTFNSQPSTAHAQGTAFTYQGRLNDGGAPANGSYDLQFILYNAGVGGSQQGPILTNAATAVSNGLFTVTLDFGAGIFTGNNVWLDISVRTNGTGTFSELSPRQRLTPTPYAEFATTASNLSGTVSAAQLNGMVPSANVTGAYTNPVTFNNSADGFAGNGAGLSGVNAATLNGLSAGNFWQLGGNNASSGQFVGTTNNVAFDLYAGGVRAIRLVLRTDASGSYSNAPNVIGGSSVNQISGGVVGGTVGGGGGNDMFGGSYPNTVTADFGTVSGGLLNIASGAEGTVGGGLQNTASAIGATVGGGQENTAGGATYGFSTVGGGLYNTADSVATVAGGYGNTASGFGSCIGGGGFDGIITAGNVASAAATFVGGGIANTNAGEYSVIGGGAYNYVGSVGAFIGGGGYDGSSYSANYVNANAAAIGGGLGNNIPEGSRYAFIGGGQANTASAYYATIAGGNGNEAEGEYSSVPGGLSDVAKGTCSFAAGNLATAQYKGSFVWADGSGFGAGDTAANQFVVLASGGFYFYTSTSGAGAKLASGATAWTTLCDRNAKKNFKPVDTLAVLNKLAAIPIEQWNYKWEMDTDTPNIGPMAQDFKAAFYPGRDDKGITTLEFDGVELAAIQGLNQKLEERSKALEQQLNHSDAEVATLRGKVADLQSQLNDLQKAVALFAGKAGASFALNSPRQEAK